MINHGETEALIKSTVSYKEALIENCNRTPVPNNLKSELISNAFDIVFEHSDAVNLLIANTLFTTTLAVLRLQYDALVRQVWLLYVASDSDIEKLSAPLTSENAQSVNNWIPSTNEMLKQLELRAPAGLYKILSDFKTYSSKALNSFVHTGIHALARKRDGFYSGMIISILKQSNNLLHMTSLALAIDSGDQTSMLNVIELSKRFSGCLELVK